MNSIEHEAFRALAAVENLSAICGDIEKPERHAVRNLKMVAEQILKEAFRNVQLIAYEAKELGRLVEVVQEETLKDDRDARNEELAARTA